jgi:hypothetical protein
MQAHWKSSQLQIKKGRLIGRPFGLIPGGDWNTC